MQPLFPALLLALSLPASAVESVTKPWFSRACGLSPISPWNYRYEACDDTTTYKSLNRALALRLDNSPEFDKYRFYRGWENAMQVPFIIGMTVMSLDIITTMFAEPLCSSSFNPDCNDAALTTLPLPYYLAFFSVSVPLNVFTSYKRIGYMEMLVGAYNRQMIPAQAE